MSTLSRRFVWIDDHDSGMQGWLPQSVKDIEVFIPSSGGLGVAHDMIEHPRIDGTNVDELLAAGHLWYGRLESGQLPKNPGPSYLPDWHTTAIQVSDAFVDTDFADISKIRRPVDRHDTLDYFDRMANEIEARALQNIHWADNCGDLLTISPDRTQQEVDEFERYAAQWVADAMNWVRRGILQANRRWGDGNAAADVFWELAGAIDQRHSDEEDAMRYPTMDIHINVKRRTFNIVRRDVHGHRTTRFD